MQVVKVSKFIVNGLHNPLKKQRGVNYVLATCWAAKTTLVTGVILPKRLECFPVD